MAQAWGWLNAGQDYVYLQGLLKNNDPVVQQVGEEEQSYLNNINGLIASNDQAGTDGNAEKPINTINMILDSLRNAYNKALQSETAFYNFYKKTILEKSNLIELNKNILPASLDESNYSNFILAFNSLKQDIKVFKKQIEDEIKKIEANKAKETKKNDNRTNTESMLKDMGIAMQSIFNTTTSSNDDVQQQIINYIINKIAFSIKTSNNNISIALKNPDELRLYISTIVLYALNNALKTVLLNDKSLKDTWEETKDEDKDRLLGLSNEVLDHFLTSESTYFKLTNLARDKFVNIKGKKHKLTNTYNYQQIGQSMSNTKKAEIIQKALKTDGSDIITTKITVNDTEALSRSLIDEILDVIPNALNDTSLSFGLGQSNLRADGAELYVSLDIKSNAIKNIYNNYINYINNSALTKDNDIYKNKQIFLKDSLASLREEINDKQKKIDMFEIKYTNKEYISFGKNISKAFHNGSIGADLQAQINRISTILNDIGIAKIANQNISDFFMRSIINCNDISVIGTSNKDPLEKIISSIAVSFLFDEYEILTTRNLENGDYFMQYNNDYFGNLYTIYLVRLQGFIDVPLSFILKMLIESFEKKVNEVIQMTELFDEPEDIIKAEIIPPNYTYTNPEQWKNVNGEAWKKMWKANAINAEKSYIIKVSFLANFARILNYIYEPIKEI